MGSNTWKSIWDGLIITYLNLGNYWLCHFVAILIIDSYSLAFLKDVSSIELKSQYKNFGIGKGLRVNLVPPLLVCIGIVL